MHCSFWTEKYETCVWMSRRISDRSGWMCSWITSDGLSILIHEFLCLSLKYRECLIQVIDGQDSHVQQRCSCRPWSQLGPWLIFDNTIMWGSMLCYIDNPWWFCHQYNSDRLGPLTDAAPGDHSWLHGFKESRCLTCWGVATSTGRAWIQHAFHRTDCLRRHNLQWDLGKKTGLFWAPISLDWTLWIHEWTCAHSATGYVRIL